jgi:hypothetical protein
MFWTSCVISMAFSFAYAACSSVRVTLRRTVTAVGKKSGYLKGGSLGNLGSLGSYATSIIGRKGDEGVDFTTPKTRRQTSGFDRALEMAALSLGVRNISGT